jgi:glutamyl-tRNA reductase
VENAVKIVEELKRLCVKLREQSVREVVSQILSRAEYLRMEELEEAFSKLHVIGGRERKVIDDLTKSVLKRTLLPIVGRLKTAAIYGDEQLIEAIVKLFGVEDTILLKWVKPVGGMCVRMMERADSNQ